MERNNSPRLSMLGAAALLFASVATPQDTIDTPRETAPDDVLVPVADDSSQEAVGPDFEAAQLTDEQQLVDQFERFKLLLGDGVYDEADAVGKRIVELAIRVSGPRSSETAKALTNLAIVQHQTRQFDAAQQNFEAAVDIIEENEDRLNQQLINPLKGLGASQLAGGRPDLASDTYERAIHVTHVNEGPHNLDQVDLLESLAEVNLRLGLIDDARQLQDKIYDLNLRYATSDIIELVPTLMRRAAWQHRAGLIFDERTTYRRIIQIIEDEGGDDDLRLIEPLTELGRSYFFVDMSGATTYQAGTVTSGEIYFKRAKRIADENEESGWDLVADTTLALGDYYMFQGNDQRARRVYVEAWEFLSAEEDRLERRQNELETPKLLRYRDIPEFVGSENEATSRASPEEDILQGRISLAYVVSARGRVDGLKIVEAQPAGFTPMLDSVQRELRRRVFRPIFSEGEPAESSEQLFTHRFFYTAQDLEAVQQNSEVPSENDPAEGEIVEDS